MEYIQKFCVSILIGFDILNLAVMYIYIFLTVRRIINILLWYRIVGGKRGIY